MSNWERVRNIVMKTLSDEREHPFAELKEAVRTEDESLLTSPNTLSAVLYQMMKSDARIVRTGKATYQYVGTPAVAECAADRGSFITRFRKLLQELDEKLESPSYEMSEEEFAEKKKYYQLSKKLHKVVDSYL